MSAIEQMAKSRTIISAPLNIDQILLSSPNSRRTKYTSVQVCTNTLVIKIRKKTEKYSSNFATAQQIFECRILHALNNPLTSATKSEAPSTCFRISSNCVASAYAKTQNMTTDKLVYMQIIEVAL